MTVVTVLVFLMSAFPMQLHSSLWQISHGGEAEATPSWTEARAAALASAPNVPTGQTPPIPVCHLSDGCSHDRCHSDTQMHPRWWMSRGGEAEATPSWTEACAAMPTGQTPPYHDSFPSDGCFSVAENPDACSFPNDSLPWNRFSI